MTKLKPTGCLRARASSNHYYLVRPNKNFPDYPELLYDSFFQLNSIGSANLPFKTHFVLQKFTSCSNLECQLNLYSIFKGFFFNFIGKTNLLVISCRLEDFININIKHSLVNNIK